MLKGFASTLAGLCGAALFVEFAYLAGARISDADASAMLTTIWRTLILLSLALVIVSVQSVADKLGSPTRAPDNGLDLSRNPLPKPPPAPKVETPEFLEVLR